MTGKCMPCSVARAVAKLSFKPSFVDENPPENVYPVGHPDLNAQLRKLGLGYYVRETAEGHPDRAADADPTAGTVTGRARRTKRPDAE